MDRRKFIRNTGLVSLGFLGLSKWAISAPKVNTNGYSLYPYGPLKADAKGVFELPEGFSYQIISTRGDKMTDGLLVPGKADGMAAFPTASPHKTLVVRNHELSPDQYAKEGGLGKQNEMLGKVPKNRFYDWGKGELPAIGGTTTFIYNHLTKEVETQYLSLAGTIRNCAGGLTPWGTWITCEEDVSMPGDYRGRLEKKHGYAFEVPVSETPVLADPVPIMGMGRFNHEAVCVDEKTGIVYLTEDRHEGLFYRFLPNQNGALHKGGRLQALCILDVPKADVRNWSKSDLSLEPGDSLNCTWLDLENIDDDDDTLRFRGHEKGAAVFARGEGIWMDNENRRLFFACTNGGAAKKGQIYSYDLCEREGSEPNGGKSGTLTLFIEPNNTDLLQNADNLTIAPWGDVIFCEDVPTPRIIGVTPEGELYPIAQSIHHRSELAGVCFSPDGKTLFVNIQKPGLTVVIEGPWGSRRG